MTYREPPKNAYVADGSVNTTTQVRKSTRGAGPAKKKFCRYCEAAFLGAVVFVIIGLFLIPTVYFAIYLHQVVRILRWEQQEQLVAYESGNYWWD